MGEKCVNCNCDNVYIFNKNVKQFRDAYNEFELYMSIIIHLQLQLYAERQMI